VALCPRERREGQELAVSNTVMTAVHLPQDDRQRPDPCCCRRGRLLAKRQRLLRQADLPIEREPPWDVERELGGQRALTLRNCRLRAGPQSDQQRRDAFSRGGVFRGLLNAFQHRDQGPTIALPDAEAILGVGVEYAGHALSNEDRDLR